MATILKRESGRWQARVRRQGGKSLSKTFRTKTDAEAWARQQEADIERGTWKDTSSAHRMPFNSLLDEYEQEVASKGRSRTVARYHLKRFREELGHLRLGDLTPRVLTQWRDNRLRAVKSSTVARELSTLGGVFSWAIKDKMIAIAENPVRGIRRPQPGRARDRRLYPGEEEFLLSCLASRSAISGGEKRTGLYSVGPKNPWVRVAVLLALETAMRQGELVSLTWGNVDLEERTAKLPQTKNGDSRDVPLSTAAIKILREIRPPDPRPETRVVPVSQQALKQAWARAIQQGREQYLREAKEAGVANPMPFLKDLTFHDLRHEATSRLAERLPNLIELASVTGHRDLRMLKRYYHPRASDLAKKIG